MRQIYKDIQMTIDGTPQGFRLTKPDAFSGVEILRLLPAGPHPVMTGNEWGYPELKHDTVSCMKLVLEEITWALEGFFGGGGPDSPPADVTGSRPSARTSTSSSSSR